MRFLLQGNTMSAWVIRMRGCLGCMGLNDLSLTEVKYLSPSHRLPTHAGIPFNKELGMSVSELCWLLMLLLFTNGRYFLA